MNQKENLRITKVIRGLKAVVILKKHKGKIVSLREIWHSHDFSEFILSCVKGLTMTADPTFLGLPLSTWIAVEKMDKSAAITRDSSAI